MVDLWLQPRCAGLRHSDLLQLWCNECTSALLVLPECKGVELFGEAFEQLERLERAPSPGADPPRGGGDICRS